jgi:HD-GYP domain
MIVGKKLIGKNGELLLNTGAIIRYAYIEKIKELGYGGLYVDDDISKDIQIIEVISDDLRFKAIKTIKEAFVGLEKGFESLNTSLEKIGNIVGNIVDGVLDNKDTMVNMLDLKTFDDYTYMHSTNVAVLSLILGVNLNFNKTDLHKLGLSAMLHDIGKVFMPKEILNKPDKLTDEEFRTIQAHTGKGYEYLKTNYDFPIASYLGVLQHHEKYDGTGYPIKLGGDQIHLYGRIISVTDVYDALTSNRPYRKAMLPSEAIEYIMANGGNHFDPSIVEHFTKKIAPYPVGMFVRLSNNTSGIVMENYNDSSMRPKVKITRHSNNDVEPYIINLRNDIKTLNITIVGIDDDVAPRNTGTVTH